MKRNVCKNKHDTLDIMRRIKSKERFGRMKEGGVCKLIVLIPTHQNSLSRFCYGSYPESHFDEVGTQVLHYHSLPFLEGLWKTNTCELNSSTAIVVWIVGKSFLPVLPINSLDFFLVCVM